MVKSAALRNKESRERIKVREMELRDSLFRNIEVFTETWEDGEKAITIDWNLTQVDEMAVEIMAKRKGLTVAEFLDDTCRRIINEAAKGGGRRQGGTVPNSHLTRRHHHRLSNWECGMMETIDTLAAHYGKHVLTKSGRRGFRMGCPVHSGKDPNCAVFESSAGRIGAFCFSLGCEPSAIMTAMEQDCNLEAINPLGHTFQGTYRRGSDPVDVWREDRPNGTKAYPTPGSRDGIPLLIHGREEDDLMIVIEGEKTGRAVQRARIHGGKLPRR